MSRLLKKQDIKEVLYGVTYLGGGGGGPLGISLELLEKLDDDEVNLELLDLSEMKDNEYAVMVACLGSPVKMQKTNFTVCTSTSVAGFKNEMKKEDKEVNYIYSGEYGGANTFVPILAALKLGMPLLDVDGQGRAVPEINTGLGPVYDIPIDPMVLGTMNEDVIMVHAKDPLDCKSAELIARQLCQAYDMMIGFTTWMANKKQLHNLVPGALTHAQKVGKAILKAKSEKIDVFKAISEVIEAREILRGEITDIHLEAKGGFDYGVTTVTTKDGQNYYISFQNENLLVKDSEGKVLIVVPEIISFIDLDTGNPLNNGETKVGMNVSVAAIPAHENWWKNPRGFECWKDVLARVGYTGGSVRY